MLYLFYPDISLFFKVTEFLPRNILSLIGAFCKVTIKHFDLDSLI
jgi:hypothetical protein